MGEDTYTVRVTRHSWSGAGVDQVLRPDPRRVALVVNVVQSAGTMTVHATGWPGGGFRYLLQPGSTNVVKYEDVGPLVSGGWAVEATMIGDQIDFAEILLLGR